MLGDVAELVLVDLRVEAVSERAKPSLELKLIVHPPPRPPAAAVAREAAPGGGVPSVTACLDDPLTTRR